MKTQTRSVQPFWERVGDVPARPSGSEHEDGNGTENAMRSIEEMNEAIRAHLQERMREGLTGVVGFIRPLPKPLGLPR